MRTVSSRVSIRTGVSFVPEAVGSWEVWTDKQPESKVAIKPGTEAAETGRQTNKQTTVTTAIKFVLSDTIFVQVVGRY